MFSVGHGWQKLLYLFFLFSSFVHASEISHPGTFREKRWNVPAGQCGISRFAIQNTEYENVNPHSTIGRVRGTLMAAVAETTDPSCLKDFGVVQFIRGCIYNVRYKRTENQITDRYFGLVREHRGKVIPFVYPNWDVDTVDEDPLYQSNSSNEASAGRLDFYRFPRKPLALKADPASIKSDGKTYFDAKHYGFLPEGGATLKSYFVSDLPSFAEWVPDAGAGEESWVNASLEFQTCLYRLKDIPISGSPLPLGTSSDAGGPLVCFPWSHKQTFDPQKKSFRSHQGIDLACEQISAAQNPPPYRVSISR